MKFSFGTLIILLSILFSSTSHAEVYRSYLRFGCEKHDRKGNKLGEIIVIEHRFGSTETPERLKGWFTSSLLENVPLVVKTYNKSFPTKSPKEDFIDKLSSEVPDKDPEYANGFLGGNLATVNFIGQGRKRFRADLEFKPDRAMMYDKNDKLLRFDYVCSQPRFHAITAEPLIDEEEEAAIN